MKLSVVILAKDEEETIKDCLKSVDWVDEVIVLDGGSTDKTLEIAKNAGARIVKQEGDNYAAWRNQGREEAKGKWLFYVDADERITPRLRKEIQGAIRGKQHTAFAIPRRNFLLGKELHWGGWWPDYVNEAGHPPATWWRILRMGVTTLFGRLIRKQGFRDGREGWIESIYQAFHTMIVYMQLWEIQSGKQ